MLNCEDVASFKKAVGQSELLHNDYYQSETNDLLKLCKKLEDFI